MSYQWPSVINQNTDYKDSEKYCADCQVVTAVNAHYVLTGEQVTQNTPEYYELCELAGAVAGSAICINKVYDFLGLHTCDEAHSFLDYDYNFDGIGKDYIIEANVWYKRYGFHSVAVIDYEPHCRAFRVANFKWLTTEDGWMFYEDLSQYLRHMNNGWDVRKIKMCLGEKSTTSSRP